MSVCVNMLIHVYNESKHNRNTKANNISIDYTEHCVYSCLLMWSSFELSVFIMSYSSTPSLHRYVGFLEITGVQVKCTCICRMDNNGASTVWCY